MRVWGPGAVLTENALGWTCVSTCVLSRTQAAVACSLGFPRSPASPVARCCIRTAELASLRPLGHTGIDLRGRVTQTEEGTRGSSGKEESRIILKNAHGADSRTQLTGLALVTQSGHSTEHCPRDKGRLQVARTTSPASIHCSWQGPLGRGAVLGFVGMAGICSVSGCPCGGTACLSVPLAAVCVVVSALSISPGIFPELGSCRQNSTR